MQELVFSKLLQKEFSKSILKRNSLSFNNAINSIYQRRLKSDALIISAYKKNKDFKLNLPTELKSDSAQKELTRRLKASHFEGKKFEMRSIFGLSNINEEIPDIVQVVGLGEKQKVNSDINRRAVSLYFIENKNKTKKR